VLITSNLVFSKWDQIFKDPMTTAAAVDRIVHHSIILELNIESYRAQSRQGESYRGQGTLDVDFQRRISAISEGGPAAAGPPSLLILTADRRRSTTQRPTP